MSSKDIIRWVIDRMMAHDDSITQELALTVEREARIEWGGRSIDYIRKACDGDRRTGRRPLAPESARAAYQAGIGPAPTHQVLQEQGVSRATLYRLLKRGPE
jgi:DNA invertase Pin-like site-specific DNA recombinase